MTAHTHAHKEPGNIEKWAEKEYETHPTNVLYTHSNPVVRFVEKSRQDMVVRAFRKFVSRTPKYAVLEIACQEGHTTRRLAGRNAGRVVGVDIVEDALKVARKHSPQSIEYVKANAEHLPFKDRTFDVVVASEALEHMFHPDKVVAECHRVLKTGGLVLVTVPYEEMVVKVKKTLDAFGLFRLLFPNMFSEQSHFHVQSFTRGTMRRLIERGGFAVTSAKMVPMPFLGPKIFVAARKK